MKHFTIKELSHSDTAILKGIDNYPTAEAIINLTALVNNVLDPLRERYGKPIRVSSGYRSAILNRSVNGATSSQHRLGEAADITVGSREENRKLFEIIKNELTFDQLIDERNFSWVHVSFREGRNRKQVLKL
ncbi:D-Ala-D-Ala carboxypeptidase family metallohydrolase [Bacteroides sp.]|uniref:D-Ala-D-Ala carboxypeptidase family metallohydrolase n=1 Tax=Bacteroides sp. TaxID=29523 RepID=UPI0026156069|nr:D-Ala-D-Ala carboxypeptidase family metallohydrolase [Bacteroides sp.]MDD3038249.1 D-Ala-D-Ala carboxypeptidase family metallohydrolase [Bacteroides sp.]